MNENTIFSIFEKKIEKIYVFINFQQSQIEASRLKVIQILSKFYENITKLYENNTMVKEGHSPSMKNLIALVSLRYVRPTTDGRVLPNEPYAWGTCSKTTLIKPFVVQTSSLMQLDL